MRRPNRDQPRYTVTMRLLDGVRLSDDSRSDEAPESHPDGPAPTTRGRKWPRHLPGDARATLAIGIALGVLVGWIVGRSHGPPAPRETTGAPVTAWAAPGTRPLSDAAAAALV